MVLLYGRTGRRTAENGGFRPGAVLAEPRLPYGVHALHVLPPFDAIARMIKLAMVLALSSF